ncbi:Tripartite tricarboxylate transporter TctB family [Burkholderia sp. Ch1-1]|uniref:Tripartite tricarboxylate transporter TctB family n=1 Tax=Paraburkholderia dioscoreae TaxID=2604047 RepID=A0A5Q4Z344_9BURK|nr:MULTISPECIES: tripartite tricarboxylate transporter TctB family protein [Paraburkholderia]EIF33411.1 Tripartite tricarboxylate transporter TctB family [Burkholderia sp. Ch1-1]MDR8395816.1 tripartite tricarboxylate transporter TctB family protein [Paraburkholderia sp. USG1]VVD32264.1 Tripartite tricarboxylate transporter TctB family [Paraburkholderia dioscoreae]
MDATGSTDSTEHVNARRRDYYAGMLMAAVGLGAIYDGIRYSIGTLSQMGPGFFPVSIGVALVCTGVAIAVVARYAAPQDGEKKLAPERKAWCFILGSIVAFIVLGKYGGLVPATFAIVFISALGDRENTIWRALLLAAGMTVLCVLVFWWALSLQFPLFQWG